MSWAALIALAGIAALLIGAYLTTAVAKTGTSGVDVTRTPAAGQNLAGGGLAGCPASTDDGGGDWTITQSLNTVTDGANTIACGDGTDTTVNAWARCFDLSAELVPPGTFTIESATFGVQQASANGIPINVNIYLDTDGCPPVKPGTDLVFLCRRSTTVGTADEGTFKTLDFTDALPPGGVVVPVGTAVVMEIEAPRDGTEPPTYAFRMMSNDLGECADTYLRADDCGIGDFDTLTNIGFPDSHGIMIMTGHTGGTATVCGDATVEGCEACDPPDGDNLACSPECRLCSDDDVLCIHSACPGTGACELNNGTPGCEDEECCAIVCEVDVTCCEGPWNQDCADTAISLGCAFLPGEGTTVPVRENFDSYPPGALEDINGWDGWDDNPAWAGIVSTAESRSAPHSMLINGAADAVQRYLGATSGQWDFTIWQFVPNNFSGVSYFILLNTYSHGGPKNWSTQVQFDSSTGMILSDFDGETLPMITGEWVEIRVEINLDTDRQKFFYGGDLLHDKSWSDGLSGGGLLDVRTVDLFANGASAVYYDDLNLLPAGGGCPWECGVPATGDIDIVDLLALLAGWDNPGPCDFNASGAVDIVDLLKLLANWGPCP